MDRGVIKRPSGISGNSPAVIVVGGMGYVLVVRYPLANTLAGAALGGSGLALPFKSLAALHRGARHQARFVEMDASTRPPANRGSQDPGIGDQRGVLLVDKL
jgi:hypothetical protein